MSDTSLVFTTVGRDRGVSALLTRTASQVRASSAAGAAGTLAMRGAFVAAGVAAIGLANSAAQAAGAVALVPAALASAYAIVGAGRAVTMGLGDAWKATGQAATGGGRSVQGAAQKQASAAREIRQATQALAEAQRTAREAQLAITQARIDETERLDDLSRTLRGAKLDEVDAIAAVEKAEMDLALARQTGNGDKIGDAERGYAQSKQTLEEVRDRVSDLGKEQEDGAKKGVEGSDAVQAALKAQRDAQQAVTDAAERLAVAQEHVETATAGAVSGGIDPAAAALAKLSPNGRAVILMLRQLAPAWHAAAMEGQQATFAGVAGDLKRLSDMYLPSTTRWLVRMGEAFNTAIRQAMGIFLTKQGFADVNNLMDTTVKITQSLSLAVKPLINGIMQWVQIGLSFLPGFASQAQGLAVTFEQWSIGMRESGKGAEWIKNGITVLTQFWHIARDVAFSIWNIVSAGNDGGATIGMLEKGAAALRKFTASAEGQAKIKAFFDVVWTALGALLPLFDQVASHGDTFSDSLTILGSSAGWAADHMGPLVKILPTLVAGYLLLKHTGVTALAGLGIDAVKIYSQYQMAMAIRAHTTALQQNTASRTVNTAGALENAAAENAGILARGRAVLSWIAQKVAMVASTIASGAAAVAGWAVAAAEWAVASPIALIILALLALAAAVYLVWRYHDTIWKFLKKVWADILAWIKTAWTWVQGNWPKLLNILTWPFQLAMTYLGKFWKWLGDMTLRGVNYIRDRFNATVTFFQNLPGRFYNALRAVVSYITTPFRNAFNQVAYLWNSTIGRLSFTVPAWIPGIGGQGWSLPSIPYLAKGGVLTGAGSVMVGEAGPEVLTLPAGASVTPLNGANGLNGMGGGRLQIDVSGNASRHLKAFVRELFRTGGLEPGGSR